MLQFSFYEVLETEKAQDRVCCVPMVLFARMQVWWMEIARVVARQAAQTKTGPQQTSPLCLKKETTKMSIHSTIVCVCLVFTLKLKNVPNYPVPPSID